MKQLCKYKSGVIFCLVLTTCMGISMWLARFIPVERFDNMVVPVFAGMTSAIAFLGAWVMFQHTEGLRFRILWGWTLVAWGIADAAYLICWMAAPMQMMNMGAYELTDHELLIGNFLGWMLLLYPTEALRPQWLTLKHAMWSLLPMCVLVALDYVLPIKLTYIIILYPFVLLGLLVNDVREYRIWCEENFSTLDDIDVQWIMRYMIMMILVGIGYLYICMGHSHTRGFTQLWMVILMLAYSTEQILFRRNPWEMLQHSEPECPDSAEIVKNTISTDESCFHERPDAPALREALERWMDDEKPYTNPDFRLIDLQQVLPLNRTYLSQFIHNEYGCSFYQFVNRYRIEEAKRLKLEKPNLKEADVAALCGFSSASVFSRTFTTITGLQPKKWHKKIYSE